MEFTEIKDEVNATFVLLTFEKVKTKVATSGNRTRASRVAGENSTTEPTLLESRLDKVSTRQTKLEHQRLGLVWKKRYLVKNKSLYTSEPIQIYFH